MDANNKLARLHTHLNDSFEAYVKTPEAQWLLEPCDELQRLSQYNLPEITMLICASLNDQSPTWMRRFSAVSPLYVDLTQESFERSLFDLGYERFCSEVLPLLDRSRLERIVGFRMSFAGRSSAIQREIDVTKEKIDKETHVIEDEQKKLSALDSSGQERSEDDARQIKSIKTKISNRRMKIRAFSSHLEEKEADLRNCKTILAAIEQADILLSQFSVEYAQRRETVCNMLSASPSGVIDESDEPEVSDDEADLTVLAARFLKREGRMRAEMMDRLESRLFGSESPTDAVSTFYGALLDQTTGENSPTEEYALRLIELLEERADKERRRAERAEKKLAQVSESVYGACYQPIEDLEVLVANLRFFDAAIPPKLMHAQLSKPLIDLRQGLSDLGVSTVINPESWSEGGPASYDPEVHEAEVPLSDHMVVLRTMGFSYRDKWGEDCIHPAKVINKESSAKPAGHSTPNTEQTATHRNGHSAKKKLRNTGAKKNTERTEYFTRSAKSGHKKHPATSAKHISSGRNAGDKPKPAHTAKPQNAKQKIATQGSAGKKK